jgi:hypothetical protein
MSGPLEVAREAWGADLPDWVETLAIECGKTSQNRVAKRIDRSPTLVSRVLRRSYPGDMEAIAERVRSVFQSAVIQCPALGTMPAHVCQDWREKSREFRAGNPLRVRMYRACTACPRNAQKDGGDDAARS